ncbi:MAG: ATP-binding protein [candidate division KSB1 bacterium]|nr:ATP-binding protein [candidate division KSB1 bacterium]
MEHMDMRHSLSGARACWQQELEAPQEVRADSLGAEDFAWSSQETPSEGDDPLWNSSFPQTAFLSPHQTLEVTRHCVEIAAEALLAFTREGTVVYLNRACAALLGQPKETLLGKRVEVLFGPDCPFLTPFSPSEPRTCRSWTCEWDWFRPDGRVIPLAITCMEIDQGEGTDPICVVSLEDLSRIRLLEERLRGSQKLEAAGGLAAGIVHDIKSFLSGILGCARFLLAELDERHAHYGELKSIAETANTAIDLANRLLALARGNSSQRLVCSLNRLVERTAAVLQRSVAQNVRVRVSLCEEMPSVLCNPGEIEQVLMNLGINAADAMPNGGELLFRTGVVEVDEETCRPDPQFRPGRYVFFSVQDTGVGIPPYLRRKIFEPLFTTKQPGKGTGMGLAVAESIVREHRGLITVDSRVGVGSRFTVYLPLAVEEQAEPLSVETAKA